MIARTLPPELTAEEWRQLGLDPDDPFRYGWREVARQQADGTTTYERIPLTLENVVHPHEDDDILQDEEHVNWCRYLYTILQHLLAQDPLAVVFQDHLFLWDVPGLKGHAPDIAVVFGVSAGQRSSFNIAAEGVRPALIIEITSPTTANLDYQTKLEEYHLVGVPYYIIIDRQITRGRRDVRLRGYRDAPVGYEPLEADERGWLWLAPVRAWLGIADGQPVLCTEAGEPIGDYRQVVADRDAAERRAAEAEAQLREVEAALRRLQQDAPPSR